MKKLDYFLLAMQNELYRRRAWVITAFSIIAEGPNDWEKDPYPYRLVRTPTGYCFVNPEAHNRGHDQLPILTWIEDSPEGNEPLFDIHDKVNLHVGKVPNFTQEHQLGNEMVTSYGLLLFNYIILIYPFNDKVAYINKRISPGGIEDIIIGRLVDNPTKSAKMVLDALDRRKQHIDSGDVKPILIDGVSPIDSSELAPTKKPIYVSEYLKFTNACFYIVAFTQLWVPGVSAKAITAPPGIKEFRDRLLEENKDHLSDPATIAKIDAELVKYDAQYLKGDSSEGFLISGKSRNTVRRKLFLMTGAETGLEDKVDMDLISTSLAEGWDISKFPIMNDSLRAGSFNRGAQTELGGVAVKWLLRVSSNIAIDQEDCLTNLGIPTEITDQNKDKYLGFSAVTKAGHDVLTEGNIGKYLGHKVMIRSPLFCKSEGSNYCSVCIGPRLAASPTALSAAVASYGNTFLDIFMSAAHSKSLILEHMDYKSAIT